MKKIILFFFVIFSLTVFSVYGQTEADFKVSVDLSGNGVIIDKYRGAKVTECVIPSTIQGYPVTEIGKRAFTLSQRITSVVIPEGVTKIGDEAFSFCSKLETVKLPSTLKTIGENAFRNCNNLSLATQAEIRRLGYTGRF